ncbi:MAG: SDR family NAD(P)-dependent oxidoreductase [Gammaproteobacteria bacterium]
MGTLDDRIALVTGGGRGIGRAIALAFARAGADVAITSRTQHELDAVVGEIEALGRRGLAIVADAMRHEDAVRTVATVVDRWGAIHVLLNNAGGIAMPQSPDGLAAESHEDQAFIDNLMLNLVSAQRMSREALPHMLAQGYGRIINIGSGYAKHGGGLLAYTAAKHGIVGLTRGMATEVATRGVTVNCLSPGWTNTSLLDWDLLGAGWGVDAATAKARAEADCIQNRIVEPEELGPMAVLLASPEGGAITGQLVCVDGGFKV